jgi:response regulator RpfG family c-di-GMP phosphodiesterase
MSHIKIDLSKIYARAFSRSAPRDISVVVIDYHMPDISGEQVASAIIDNNIKKLMLTGQPNDQKAIQLLNDGFIDNYAEKKVINNVDHISTKIAKLQRQYFNSLCAPIKESIKKQCGIIYNNRYNEILERHIEQLNIVQHYLITNQGSRLLINQQGEQYWFIVATEEDFKGWAETAQYADAREAVQHRLASRTHLLFLFSDTEQEQPPSQWSNYLHEAKSFSIGKENLYYALVKKTKKIC